MQANATKIDQYIQSASDQSAAGTLTPEKAAGYYERIKHYTDQIAENAKGMEAILAPLRQAEAVSNAINTNLDFSGIITNLALDPSSMKDTHLAVKDTMKKAVLDGVIQGMLASGPVKAAMDKAGADLNLAISHALETGDYSGLKEAAKTAGTAMNKEMDALQPVFEQIGFSFGDGFTQRMQDAQGIVSSAAGNAFKTGATFEQFTSDVKAGVRDKVKEGLLNAFVQSAVMTKTLKPIMDQIDDVFSRVGKGDLGMKKAGKELDGLLDDLDKGLNDPELSGLYDKVQGAMERLGSASSVSVEQSFGTAISNAFNNVQGYTDFTQGIRDQLYQQVSEGLINAFMQSAIVQQSLAPVLEAISGIFDQVNNKQMTIAEANSAIAVQVGALNAAMGSPELKAMFDSVNTAMQSTASSLGVTRVAVQQTTSGLNQATESAKNAECAECSLEEKLSKRNAGIGAATAMGGSVTAGFESMVLAPKSDGKPTIDYKRIPRLAMGGILTEATLAVIAENGPEAVVPLNRLATSSPDLGNLVSAVSTTLDSGLTKLSSALKPTDSGGNLGDLVAKLSEAVGGVEGIAARTSGRMSAKPDQSSRVMGAMGGMSGLLSGVSSGAENLKDLSDAIKKSAVAGADAGASLENIGSVMKSLDLSAIASAPSVELAANKLKELSAASADALPIGDLAATLRSANGPEALEMASALKGIAEAASSSDAAKVLSDAMGAVSDASQAAGSTTQMSDAIGKISSAASGSSGDSQQMAAALEKVAEASGAQASTAQMADAIKQVSESASANAGSTTQLSDALSKVATVAGANAGSTTVLSDAVVKMAGVGTLDIKRASDSLVTLGNAEMPQLASAADALAGATGKFALTNSLASAVGDLATQASRSDETQKMADKIGAVTYASAFGYSNVQTMSEKIKQAGDNAYPAANALREVATVLGLIKLPDKPPPSPPPAAFGGSFSGSAIVGEAGAPELVTALSGGGFRVTPLSHGSAQRLMSSGFGGLKFGGTVRSDSRIMAGGGIATAPDYGTKPEDRSREFAELRNEVRELRATLSEFASATRDRSIVLELDGRVIAKNTVKELEKKSRAGRANLNRVR